MISDCMTTLFQRGQPVDMVTLRAELEGRSKPCAVGGDEYILSLTDTIPTVAHLSHAHIVRDKAFVRSLITVCSEIQAKVLTPTTARFRSSSIRLRERILCRATEDERSLSARKTC